MLLKESTLRKLIREALGGHIPPGFTLTRDLRLSDDLVRRQSQPNTYNTNNGVIVAVDGNGKVYSWVPGGSSSRKVSFEGAVESLESAGFRRANMNVPGSNRSDW